MLIDDRRGAAATLGNYHVNPARARIGMTQKVMRSRAARCTGDSTNERKKRVAAWKTGHAFVGRAGLVSVKGHNLRTDAAVLGNLRTWPIGAVERGAKVLEKLRPVIENTRADLVENLDGW